MSNSVLSASQFADPFALTPAQADQYKGLAREAFASAKAHREGGDLNSADEATRFGAVYREQARAGTTRGVGRTTWRHGDTPVKRVLP